MRNLIVEKNSSILNSIVEKLSSGDLRIYVAYNLSNIKVYNHINSHELILDIGNFKGSTLSTSLILKTSLSMNEKIIYRISNLVFINSSILMLSKQEVFKSWGRENSSNKNLICTTTKDILAKIIKMEEL